MKKNLLFLVLILIVSELPAQQENWFPLSVGNKYQYTENMSVHSKGGYSFSSSLLKLMTISKDTVINDSRYYFYDSIWTRYSDDNKIFIWDGTKDRLYMDFNLLPGTQFVSFTGGDSTTVYVRQGNFSFLDASVQYKGFGPGSGAYGNFHFFVKGVGRVENYIYNGDEFGSGLLLVEVINCLVADTTGNFIYYSEHIKPSVSGSPILFTMSENFQWFINASHDLSGRDYNFIDKVSFISYYSMNNDSVCTLSDTLQMSPYTNNYYLISKTLDTVMLKQGWVFKYKAIVSDKNLIPEISSVPDTGFYSCIWHYPVSGVEDGNIILTHSLEQNYPNPFNPATVIRFTVGGSPNIDHNVSIKIFDVLGKEAAVLVNELKTTGVYEINFNSSDYCLPSGVYFCKLTIDDYTSIRKMLLMK